MAKLRVMCGIPLYTGEVKYYTTLYIYNVYVMYDVQCKSVSKMTAEYMASHYISRVPIWLHITSLSGRSPIGNAAINRSGLV